MESDQKHDWNYRLVRYFLNNHHLTIMSMVFIVVVGLFGFFRLQLQGFPQIKIPIVIVSVVSPGSGPDTVARTVVQPIEDALANINDVLEITSTSRSNFGVVVVRLKENADPNIAVQEARTKIASLELPEGVPTPIISVPDVNGTPYIISLTSNESLQSLIGQSSVITEALEQVNGVGTVFTLSKISENFYIDLDPRSQTPDILNKLKSLRVAFPIC